MTDSSIRPRIALGDLQAIDPGAMVKAAEPLDQDMFASMLEGMYTRPSGPADNAPENIFATVRVGGKVVATLYNGGVAEMTNAAAGQVGALDMDGAGPDLARRRAEQIAAALGGTVEMADTAQSEAAWNARPERTFFLDVEAMKQDGVYERWLAAQDGGGALLLAQSEA